MMIGLQNCLCDKFRVLLWFFLVNVCENE